jgi:tetratricopeptide (TPR) repeat protein
MKRVLSFPAMVTTITIIAALFISSACSDSGSHVNALQSVILSDDWQSVYDECYTNDSLLQKSETAALLGHAAIMLNKCNESYMLFRYLNHDTALNTGWMNWATDFYKQNPKKAVANYFLGDALMRNQNHSEAIKYFNKALSIAPAFPLALNARGLYFSMIEEKGKAMKDLNACLRASPDIAEFYINRATIKFYKKAPEGALEDFEHALSISPFSVLALNGKACAMTFSTNTGLTPESELDSISHYLSQASFLLHDPVFQSNIRNLTLDIENRIYPELKDDPLFRVSDFLDWNGLKAITEQNENDVLRLITQAPLPDFIDGDFLIALNISLTDPDLFKNILKNRELSDSAKSIILSINNELDNTQHKNRIILEKLYEGLFANYQNRNPGMQITSDRGIIWANEYRANMPTPNIISAQDRVNAYRHGADMFESTGIPIVSYLGKQWNRHLDNATEQNRRALEQRGYDQRQTNPGGALADIKRSSIDGDEPYFLICPNGMGYEKD